MCGIAGFIDYNKKTSAATLKRMTDALEHRGPDDAGTEIFNAAPASVGLGQRRLSILDLSPLGHQPYHFQHLSLVFNGEIYNFREIKSELVEKGYQFVSQSDTEVIIKGYHCWGIEVVQKFVGMFAIVIYDQVKDQIVMIRDRAGVKPLYYFLKEDVIVFGSELKALYQHECFEKTIDVDGLALYLQYSYIPAPHTIFKNTYKLLPGHFATISLKNKGFRQSKYWDVFDFYNKPKIKVTDQQAIDETEAILKKAYKYRMVADVPVGVFLSGGYDSSSVAALLQSETTDRLKTFTIGFHENEFNEAPEAKNIAAYLGTDHTEWYLTANDAGAILNLLPEIYDEPFADNSTVPTVLVSKLARTKVKVALSADGGDEVFGGYNKYNQAERYTSVIPAALQRFLSGTMSLVNPELIPYFKNKQNFATRYEKMKLIWKEQDPIAAVKYIGQYITETETATFLKQPFSKAHSFFDDGNKLEHNNGVANRLLAVDYKTFLVDNNLVKVDRATMSVGLEGREPMLDHVLIEYLAQLDSSFKIRNGQTKWLLKQIVHRYIPRELMERPKRPFIAPLMVWFKDKLKQELEYYLSEKCLNASGLFNTMPIIQLKNDYLAGKKVNYQKLWQILVFQLWYDRWISKL